MNTNEFPRPIKLDTLGEEARTITVTAGAEERAALARRFGLVAIDRLDAELALKREGEIVHAQGRLSAQVVQSCVATAEPLPVVIGEAFTLRFVPAAMAADAEEIELSEEDCDIIAYADSAIDVGEAVAETMALALDPFPRSPNAEATLRAAGVVEEGQEEKAGPFAALGALKDRLSK
jgi:uncharacterized metal-binding protein YceD (DUF177 family)